MDSLGQIFTSAEGLSNDLLLRSRALTSTVEHVTLKIDQRPYQIFDVGGSRSERNKWTQCIKNVDALIFVAPLTGYCQPLVEDPEMVRFPCNIEIKDELLTNGLGEPNARVTGSLQTSHRA